MRVTLQILRHGKECRWQACPCCTLLRGRYCSSGRLVSAWPASSCSWSTWSCYQPQQNCYLWMCKPLHITGRQGNKDVMGLHLSAKPRGCDLL